MDDEATGQEDETETGRFNHDTSITHQPARRYKKIMVSCRQKKGVKMNPENKSSFVTEANVAFDLGIFIWPLSHISGLHSRGDVVLCLQHQQTAHRSILLS